MIEVKPSIKEMFQDPDYAWNLLQSEIQLDTSQDISGDHISHLLQLYMRGVERMNSYIDVRQSFFKNKVTSLMSRPNVIRILSNPMSKKKNPDTVEISSPQKAVTKTQLQLQQKRKEMEMRLAYGVEEHSPQALQKMMAEQGQKQNHLKKRIDNIMDSHEQKLKERIKMRKIKAMTAKSRSEIVREDEVNGVSEFKIENGFHDQHKKQIQRKRDEEQFGSPESFKKKEKKKQCKSLDVKKRIHFEIEDTSNKARRISMEFNNVVLKF